MIEEGRALFLQIAEGVEDSIIDGSLAEEAQAPSTNELAAFFRINPATAAKGVNMLVDKGVLYKRRGIGMFVAPGARELLLAERRTAFADRFVEPLLAEARKLGLGPDDLSRLILDRARRSARSIRHHGRSRTMTDVIEVQRPHEALPRHARGRRRVVHDREGHDLRPARPQRRRQDHRHVDPHRAELRHERRRPRLRREARTRTPGCCSRMCFVRESQKYPDDAKPEHAFRYGAAVLPALGPGASPIG